MREEIMAILGKQKKKGNYSQYQSKRDSRRQYFLGDESSLHNDTSIPEIHYHQESTPAADGDYFVPEVSESPMAHLHIGSL